MKSLRIAVDARPLSYPMVGITRYTYELITRLVHSPHQWFLYLDREPLHPIPKLPNVHIRYGSVKNRALSTLFAQTFFPFWAMQDKTDLFWSPRHHLPYLLPKKIKRLLTIHDMVWRLYPETMSFSGKWVERLLMPPSIKSATRIMTVSNSTKDDLIKYAPHFSKKISAIYSGLSYVPATTSTNHDLDPYFLFVGTLEPRKNLPRLLNAFAVLAKMEKTARLVVVGGKGWGNEALAQQVNRLGVRGRIELTGSVSEQELANYYADATALVMPSLYEGFGLPLVEAMGHGVPVISSNFGAMAEICGDAGLLVDPYKEQEITRAMLEMLNKESRLAFSDKALKRASYFNWENAAKEVLSEIGLCYLSPST